MAPYQDQNNITKQYPVTCSFLDAGLLSRLKKAQNREDPRRFPDIIAELSQQPGIPPFLPDLARLEQARHAALSAASLPCIEPSGCLELNPTVQLIPVSWGNLPLLFHTDSLPPGTFLPKEEHEMVIIWRDPRAGDVQVRTASAEDLLALKAVVEGISPADIARQGNTTAGVVDRILLDAVQKGILLSPPSKIKRSYLYSPDSRQVIQEDQTSVFTIQWHITQACDLHCKHCYDRSGHGSMSLEQGIMALDKLRNFCKERFVQGHITFSGGNPFLCEHFMDLYSAAADLGFSLAILGNPVPRAQLEEIIAIGEPAHFQVSLEGLPEHNDFIRGKGNFENVVRFLGLLKELGIYSMVMLTLTKDNIDQVLPLADILRDKTDLFTFNRLSLVGEGANLQPPDKAGYERFLDSYLAAAKSNPVLGYKDNLLNISLQRRGSGLFEGCTGYGCGAAFNFMAVLADGEVHACRKFPSPVGNIITQDLGEIYDSATARRYRTRPSSCLSCPLCSVCGGCLAVTSSHGLDISKDRDPYCFIRQDP